MRVEIDNVKFITGIRGTVCPAFTFKDISKEKSDKNIDALMFTSLKESSDLGIGENSVLTLKEDKGGNMVIDEVEVKSMNAKSLQYPVFCPSCLEVLKTNNTRDEHNSKCESSICFAKPTSHIHILYRIALGSLYKEDHINSVIEKYPIGASGPGRIDSLAEFKLAFDSIKAKNTQARVQHWMEIHGEELGRIFWGYELELDKYLKEDTDYVHGFWAVAHLKNREEADYDLLPKYLPSELLTTSNEKLISGGFSEKFIATVNQNLDFIMYLEKFFKGYSDRKWLLKSEES